MAGHGCRSASNWTVKVGADPRLAQSIRYRGPRAGYTVSLVGGWRQWMSTFAMAVNRDKPDKWKADIAQSADMYNNWFAQFAPVSYRATRVQTPRDVEATLTA